MSSYTPTFFRPQEIAHFYQKVHVEASEINDNLKQAGTGPSRRHIQGSKIAKRLPSVKYSFTVLENRNFLKKNFSKKLHTQKKWTEWRAGAR